MVNVFLFAHSLQNLSSISTLIVQILSRTKKETETKEGFKCTSEGLKWEWCFLSTVLPIIIASLVPSVKMLLRHKHVANLILIDFFLEFVVRVCSVSLETAKKFLAKICVRR